MLWVNLTIPTYFLFRLIFNTQQTGSDLRRAVAESELGSGFVPKAMKASLTVGLFALFAPSCWGFSPGLAAPAVRGPRFAARVQQQPVAVVVDISSTDELNEALEKAGDKLVVVDYSTSWCGPCKILSLIHI